MFCIWIVICQSSLLSNKIQDFMLTFTWDTSIWIEDFYVFPERVAVESWIYIPLTKIIKDWNYYRNTWRDLDNRLINSVPGVITLESKLFSTYWSMLSEADMPFLRQISRKTSFFSWSFLLSNAERNRRDLCWFILALGATPS